MPDEPSNITQFKEMVGRLLGVLYARHPEAQWRSVEIVFGEDYTPQDEALFEDTTSYLVENGYLTARRDGTIRLNDRSFDVLQKSNPLAPDQTLGGSLAGWASGAVADVTKTTVAKYAGAAIDALYAVMKGGL